MELSRPAIKVLRVFIENPTSEQYGFGLMAATKVQSGSLYPILRRFEDAGWVEAREESIDERAAGRPKRRLYHLTGLGEAEGRKALADLYSDLGVRPRWLPGFEGAGYGT